MINKTKISRLIKIKGPLLMIDKIKNYKLNKNILATLSVKKNDWFYKFHLINKPIMPGILMEESMFQSAVCLLKLDKKNILPEFLLLQTNSKFYSEISGDNQLNVVTDLYKKKKNLCYFKSKIIIKDFIKCKSEFILLKKN
jgi:UDP-3-O-[3-hydroxymyristoyl] N-acetylglucosamine deacetylase/3-hydroxyacyl-[acyl-carrier-protein] dehydratase